MSYTYQTFVAALADSTVGQIADPSFLKQIANIINDSEQRIYRDLGLLNTVVVDHSGSLTANQRLFTLPTSSGTFVTVREIAIFTGSYPAGRVMLLPKPYEVLDFIFPSETGTNGVSPQYYAPVTDQTIIVAPAPYTTNTVEVRGTIRPTGLSTSNPTTFLSTNLPDLFFASAMNSAMGRLPFINVQQKIDWGQEYQARLVSANVEETKRKFQFGDWTPKPQ